VLFGNYRGLHKETKILICSAIFPSISYGMFYTDISYFLTSIQGLPDTTMGLIVTLIGVSAFSASIPLGIAADRFGRKKMLITGNIIASAILAVFALTTNPALLYAAAIGEGIAEGAFSASMGALIAEKATVNKRNSAFSLYGFTQSMAFGLGSLIIPVTLVFESYGFSNRESHVVLYVLLASLSLASTFIMLRIGESTQLNRTKLSLRGFLPRKSRDTLIKYVVAGALIAFGAGMVVPLMTRWMNLKYGISDTVSGPMLGITSIFIGLATLAAPTLAKRIGLVKAVVTTQAASTVFMFLTPISPTFLIASFSYTLRAFLMNMSSPLQQSMIMGLVADEERGAASGVSSAMWTLPNALSSYIGAYLMGLGLLSLPFFLATLFYCVSIALFWCFFRKTLMPEEVTAHSTAR
jgi:MFS family permease